MAPNPRVGNAFRAMKELGISEDTVKPVLKRLLKLYDKNWELIEEENYRTLADAIFEYEDTKAAGRKKPNNNIQEQEDELGEGDQMQVEPERPLKRLRRHQELPVLSSVNGSNAIHGGASLIRPKMEVDEPPETSSPHMTQEISQPISPSMHLRLVGKQPVTPKPLALQERSEQTHQLENTRRTDYTHSSQINLRDKGKEPLSPPIPSGPLRSYSRRSSQSICLKEPQVDPGIILAPKTKVPDTFVLIKPKDEPVTDDVNDVPEFEVPLAIIPPDPMCLRNSTERNRSVVMPDGPRIPVSQYVNGKNKGESVSTSSTENKNDELANISEELEIASSSLGEVKVSLSCNSAGRSDFCMPSLDAVLKMVEDKCLRSYKITDPNFSVMNLMRDMCESFLVLGTDSTDRDKSLDVQNTSDARDDEEKSNTMPSFLENQVSLEVVVPEILRLPRSLNGMVGHVSHGCASDKEKEMMDSDYENSHALVVKQNQLSLDDIRSVYNVNDITKGEERVIIPLINEINSTCPPSFHYIPQNLVFQKAFVNFSLAQIGDDDCCSTCFGDCLSSETTCACARETGGEYAYKLDGRLKEDFLEECISMKHVPQKPSPYYCEECPLERSKNEEMSEPCKGHLIRKFIKECWCKCGCSKQCGNRLVQRGITYNLQVFMTSEGKGWGLRTLEDIPKGAFVCEYNGEILTINELYDQNMRRGGNHAFPVLLDANWGSGNQLEDDKVLCLNAASYGNVGRFINHRCLDSNLVEIPVVMESPDRHYYHLAFFATRKIDAMEELTWDYGIDFDDNDHPIKAFRCACGSRFCRNMTRSNKSRQMAIR